MTGSTDPTLLRSSLRRIGTIGTTLVFVAAAVAAVSTGSTFLQSRAAATALPDPAEPVPVSVAPLALQEGYTRIRAFVGQVEPATQIEMSFELAGRMIERPVDEGDTVTKGAVIARLDIELLSAERDRLEASRAALAAQRDFAQRQLERAQALRQQGFSSVEREDQARAARDELQNRIIETGAALDAVDIRLEKSVLRAPFAGQVGRLSADPGTTLAAGQPVLTLIEHTAPQVRVGLPLSVDPAQLVSAEIDIGSTRYPADLLQIRPDIDAATRTRTALFALETDTPQTFGRTATLRLPVTVEMRGAWVPLDALTKGDGGLWTILVVEEDIVRTAGVEVLHAEADRAYVRGSFDDDALFVRRGAHRIVPGQAVRIQLAGG
jgi:RND family efflux transporter MFP subunit